MSDTHRQSNGWVEETLAALTWDEKIALLAGRNLWETVAIDRLGIPPLKVTDGPNGARGADGNHGPTSTSFPVGAAMGATFDPGLIEEVGRALAHETRAKGADVLLGPTVNIPRVPIAGRNFECFSEDPLLSGTIAAAYIAGVQGEGVGACIKHFVCNDQEFERFTMSASVDERTLREIYLEPFRIAVERSAPWAVMSAYNRINGVTASEHPMLDDVLRSELGFDGVVLSDWYGTYSPGVVSGGLDLEMPGPARWMAAEHVRDAVAAGSLDEASVDAKVRRLLTLLDRTGARHRSSPPEERAEELREHRELARRVARDSIVLLTNRAALPFDTPGRLAVIGRLAAATPHQGGGSSAVNPHRVVTILDGLAAAAPVATEIVASPGPPVHRFPPGFDITAITHHDGERGFFVEYFASSELDGEPVRSLSSTKSYLAFFGRGDAWVVHDAFSVRLSGRFRASREGRHTFGVSAGGRARVTADGSEVADRWSDDARGPATWEADLRDGDEIDLVVEYASRPGDRFRWISVGCEPPGAHDPIGDAAAIAGECDAAIVVVGLTPEWESEGFDRPDLRLPGEQDRLVEAVVDAQPNTVVVVVSGSAVEMPWQERAAAVLQVWYGGQEVGAAVADVLFGRVDPGGRLPVTFPHDSRQHPGLLNYPGEAGTVRYGEGVYVGYRGYDRLGLEPAFPFGHGLSYTTFDLSDAEVVDRDGTLVASATLRNVGTRNGVEVVQLFARDIGGVDRRLVGFTKIRLDVGDSAVVQIPAPSERLRWWDPANRSWAMPDGPVAFEMRGTFGAITAAPVA